MGKLETDEKILLAARAEFLCNGYDGARMRAIAERAGINKGLLHYYFKTKDALLVHVFQETFQELFDALALAFQSRKTLFEKIEAAVSVYTDFMIKHPELPAFIIHEMNRGGSEHIGRMKKAGIRPPLAAFAESFIQEQKQGLIKPELKPGDVMLNMISMILFPIISKRMVIYMHQVNESEYRKMLENRKTTISEFIINAIKTWVINRTLQEDTLPFYGRSQSL